MGQKERDRIKKQRANSTTIDFMRSRLARTVALWKTASQIRKDVMKVLDESLVAVNELQAEVNKRADDLLTAKDKLALATIQHDELVKEAAHADEQTTPLEKAAILLFESLFGHSEEADIEIKNLASYVNADMVSRSVPPEATSMDDVIAWFESGASAPDPVVEEEPVEEVKIIPLPVVEDQKLPTVTMTAPSTQVEEPEMPKIPIPVPSDAVEKIEPAAEEVKDQAQVSKETPDRPRFLVEDLLPPSAPVPPVDETQKTQPVENPQTIMPADLEENPRPPKKEKPFGMDCWDGKEI